MNKLNELAGYKINIQISVVFLYTDNEHLRKKERKQSHSQ